MNHFFCNRMMLALTVVALFVCLGRAQATDLSGSYSSVTIYEDSRLTGDVTCTAPLASCIVFGASHIKLSLNGHTITGPVDPLTNLASCSKRGDSTFGVGIEATDQNDIEIEGPGVIQHFQRWGILLDSFNLATVTDIHVTKVTATRNCWSGMQTIGVSDSHFKENVWANNAAGSNGAACGGVCLISSNNNAIRKSTFYGNGSVDYTNGNVDFGVGLEGTSSGNRIEENDMGGNTNGVLVFGAASDNVIRHNIIVGNPPGQVSKTFTASNQAGADIHDRHASAGANTFEDNFCLTYLGPGAPPCPNIRTEGVEEAANRLTSPVKNRPESSRGKTTEHGGQIFSVVAVLLATAFRRLGLGK